MVGEPETFRVATTPCKKMVQSSIVGNARQVSMLDAPPVKYNGNEKRDQCANIGNHGAHVCMNIAVRLYSCA